MAHWDENRGISQCRCAMTKSCHCGGRSPLLHSLSVQVRPCHPELVSGSINGECSPHIKSQLIDSGSESGMTLMVIQRDDRHNTLSLRERVKGEGATLQTPHQEVTKLAMLVKSHYPLLKRRGSFSVSHRGVLD